MKKKIMIVDDDKEFLEETKEMLEERDFTVIPVSEGGIVSLEANRTKPDVILLDMKLKGSSGLSVFESLKNKRSTAKIPLIGITGVYGKSVGMLSSYGIKEWLLKPFSPDMLIDKIEQVFLSQELKEAIKNVKKSGINKQSGQGA